MAAADKQAEPRTRTARSAAPIGTTAEFENGDVFHYWLQTGDTWQADHVYQLGDIVSPSVPVSTQITRRRG